MDKLANIGLPTRSELERLNSMWMGYKYIVVATGISDDSLALNSLGITEVEFPQVSLQYKELPTLSTQQEFIPTKKIVGDLILRAPVVRNSAFFKLWKNQAATLTGSDNKAINLLVAEYGNQAVTDTLLPITIWVAAGCQPKTFKTASANANFTGSIPLEQITFRVTDFYRPTFSF